MFSSVDEGQTGSPNKWIVALSISLGNLMGAIDGSIINVALPQLQGAVGASVSDLTWINTAYTMAMVALMPLAPYIGRRLGQKRLYLACLALFIGGSVLAGLQTSLVGLIACRVLQGLGAGVLQPTEQAILRQTFPKEEQGMAMAIFGVIVMLGPAIGPSLGGFILDHASWNWIFFINVPIGVLGFFLVTTILKEDPELAALNRERAKVERSNTDWAGAILLMTSLVLGVWALEEGPSQSWLESRTIATALAVMTASFAAFVVRALSAPAPVVDLRLFRDRSFAIGVAVNGVLGATLFAAIFLQPLFMEDLLGLTPMRTSIMLLPRSLVLMASIFGVGVINDKVAPRTLIVIGILITVWAAFDMSHLTTESGTWELVRGSMWQGLGMAFMFVPMETAALANIPKARVADATAISALLGEAGGAIGIAAAGAIFEQNDALARTAVAAQVTPAVAFRFPSVIDAALREASVLAYERTFLMSALALLAVAPLVWFLRAPLATTEAEAKT